MHEQLTSMYQYNFIIGSIRNIPEPDIAIDYGFTVSTRVIKTFP